MSEKEKKPEKFGETPKIRPRHVDKTDVESSETEERKRWSLLERKSDEEWIAKLKTPENKEDPSIGSLEPLGLPLPPGLPPPPRHVTWEENEAKMLADEKQPELPAQATDESEDSEPEDATDGESRSGRRRRKKSSRLSPKRFIARLRRRATWIFAMVAVAVLASLTFFRMGESRGAREGKEAALRDIAVLESRRVYTLPEEARQQLDDALLEVREGNAVQGAATLEKLVKTYPDVASLNYAAGLGMIQAGNFEKAIAFANASIDKNERVSDSHVLISIAEAQLRAQEPDTQFVNPQLKVRKILADAVAADPMNPAARMELGSLYRYMGEEDAALRELKAAKARLHPVDSHLVVDVTVALIEVENLPLEAVQPTEPTVDDVRVLFPAAYIAMRHDNFELGVRLLERCKNLLPLDTFFYLVNDKAFRRFAYRDDIKALMD